MKKIATELTNIITTHLPHLQELPEEEFSFKPSSKWSKKEILGHLIDSGQSNIRRFVKAQYEEMPSIMYNQDKWVAVMHYQQWDKADIINLWYLLNKQICYLLNEMPPDMAARKCQTDEVYTVEWLAGDYVKHLLHHLHVILNLEPVPYP